MSGRALSVRTLALTTCGRVWPVALSALASVLLAGGPMVGAVLAQGFDHDSDLPIEITADSLEVLQEEQIATFVGNVDAVQGDLVLTSDQLRVHYRASEEGEALGASSIRRIEATGNVFISSPEETAQGEFGVYDVDGALLTLEGSVVLTRDDNVVRGARLEVDLETGRSQMFAAVPSVAGGTEGQRVKAVFAPPPEQPVEPAAGPAAPKPTLDGMAGDETAARSEPTAGVVE
ncbi:MAG: LptA/OstA family protein [Pseudomonadota bacterium]